MDSDAIKKAVGIAKRNRVKMEEQVMVQYDRETYFPEIRRLQAECEKNGHSICPTTMPRTSRNFTRCLVCGKTVVALEPGVHDD